jgi:hypothetical protein
MLALQNSRKELYPQCTMASNNADWEKGWFYLRNDGAGLPPYTGKVLMAKTDTWHLGVSPSSRQQRLESLTTALRRLVDAGLGAASIIANFHHRRIVPLMERELCIFEMSDAVNPVSLVCSQLVQEPLLKEYSATRARHTISLKSVPHDDDDLPDAPPVSALLLLFGFLHPIRVCLDDPCPQMVTVDTARSDPPTPRARASGSTEQRRGQERATRTKEKRLKRQERLEQYNEEYRLREQQGLSRPLASANSLSDEEEESDGERTTSDRWEPAPLLPQAEEAAVELVPVAGAEALATGPSVDAPVGATEAPAGATEVPSQPSRKKKRGFSNLR